MRTGTHTVVFDRDPDFPRFAADPSGCLHSLLRIWRYHDGKDAHYLGSCRVCAGSPRWSDLMRLFRRVRSDRPLRRALAAALRRHLSP